MKRILVAGVCILFAVTSWADHEAGIRYDDDRTRVADGDGSSRSWCAYKANELDFGLFGTGTVGRNTLRHPSTRRIERDGKLGLGGSLSYFFHRNVGLEGYAYSESTSDHFVDQVGGDVILRFPLADSGVALYGLAGGGRQFDPAIQWVLDAGGGVEWRFLPNVGVFADARYVWADKTRDYGLGRLGLKFGF